MSDITDPLVVKLLIHLDQLQKIPSSSQLNQKLFRQCELKLRNDSSLYEGNDAILNSFGYLIMQIVKSNETSLELKNQSIEVLDAILSHYPFEKILELFTLDLLVEGLHGKNDELKVLIMKVIKKSEPADLIANTPIIVTLANLLKDPESSIRLVSEIEKCLVYLATNGELITRRISSSEILKVFNQMKVDKAVNSRLFDLIVELLPVIPTLPDSLYLVSYEEFVKEDDLLLNAFLITFYNKLLDSIRYSGSTLNHVLEKLDPQIDYITKSFVDGSFKPELKLFFNLEPVIFLGNLSYLSVDKFLQSDKTYNILKFSIENYLSDDASSFLLANVNSKLLESKEQFLNELSLSSKTMGIYRNIINYEPTFSKLPLTAASISSLNTVNFLEMLQILSSNKHSMLKMITSWPNLMNKLLDDYKTVVNDEIRQLKLGILEDLLHYKEDLGIWYEKVNNEFLIMKTGKPVEAQVGVMDMSG